MTRERKVNQMIKVYSKPQCAQCMCTKIWLNQQKIPYEAIEAETDEETIEYIRSLGYTQLPIVYVDPETHWSGFQPDKLDGLK